jgi:c-di-GMP phosphodiesterase
LAAENGLRALESVDSCGIRPALILLDLTMPVMDGATFLSQIPRHMRLAAVPVIIMSGDSSAIRLRAERPTTVIEVLPKPIDTQLLMELIRTHTAPQGN